MSHSVEPFLHAFLLDGSAQEPFIEPGRSIHTNRALEASERKMFLSELSYGGIAPDRCVNFEKLAAAMKKSGMRFSSEASSRIFASVAACRSDGLVAAKEFVDYYLKRKRELGNILENSYRELETIKKTILQSDAELAKYASDEAHLRPHFEESKLTVQIVSIQNLPTGEDDPTTMYKVHLECQQQVIETRAVYQSAGIAYFNEMFSFQIGTNQGELRMRFILLEPFTGEESLLGEFPIPIDELSDQRKHEMSREFYNSDGAELILSCQWLYSRRKLYEEYLEEYNAKESDTLREVSEYQNEFDELNKPFAGGGGGGLSQALSVAPKALSDAIDRTMSHFKLFHWQVAADYIVMLTLVLLCITSYSRCVFFDQALAAYIFWCNLEPNCWTVKKYSYLIAANACSTVLDFCWMSVYFAAWNQDATEADLHSISKIGTFFLFFWKMMLILFLWRGRYEAQKKATYSEQMNRLMAISQQAQMQEINYDRQMYRPPEYYSS